MGAPKKYSVKSGCLSFVSNYIEESVHFRNIRYILAGSKKCILHIREFGIFETYIPLAQLYAQLPKDQFVQISRSCIVAIDEISLITPKHVLLTDGTELGITAAHYDELQRRYNNYEASGIKVGTVPDL